MLLRRRLQQLACCVNAAAFGVLLTLLVAHVLAREHLPNVALGRNNASFFFEGPQEGDDTHGHHPPFGVNWRIVAGCVAAFLLGCGVDVWQAAGGSLLVPLFTLLIGFGLKAATGLSQACIAGASAAALSANLFRSRPSADGGAAPSSAPACRPLAWQPPQPQQQQPCVDLDLALLLAPGLLLGVAVGVVLNDLLPVWFITALMVAVLLHTCQRTALRGLTAWHEEEQAQLSAAAAAAISAGPRPVLRPILTSSPAARSGGGAAAAGSSGPSSPRSPGAGSAREAGSGASFRDAYFFLPGASELPGAAGAAADAAGAAAGAAAGSPAGAAQPAAAARPAAAPPPLPAAAAGREACVQQPEEQPETQQQQAWSDSSVDGDGDDSSSDASAALASRRQRSATPAYQVETTLLRPAWRPPCTALAPAAGAGDAAAAGRSCGAAGSTAAPGGGKATPAPRPTQQLLQLQLSAFPWTKLFSLAMVWMGYLGLTALNALLPLCSWAYVTYLLLFALLTAVLTACLVRVILVRPAPALLLPWSPRGAAHDTGGSGQQRQQQQQEAGVGLQQRARQLAGRLLAARAAVPAAVAAWRRPARHWCHTLTGFGAPATDPAAQQQPSQQQQQQQPTAPGLTPGAAAAEAMEAGPSPPGGAQAVPARLSLFSRMRLQQQQQAAQQGLRQPLLLLGPEYAAAAPAGAGGGGSDAPGSRHGQLAAAARRMWGSVTGAAPAATATAAPEPLPSIGLQDEQPALDEPPFPAPLPSPPLPLAPAGVAAGAGRRGSCSSTRPPPMVHVAAAGAAVALATGIIAGVCGVAGSALLLPILLDFRVHPQVAGATSVVLAFLSSSAACLAFILQGRLLGSYALLFCLVSVCGGCAGVSLVGALLALTRRPSLAVLCLAAALGAGGLACAGAGLAELAADVREGERLGFRALCSEV